MKSLQFIYEDNAIQFLVNPGQDSVMINATEMAKVFGKRTDVFLKTDHVKRFISILERTPNGGRNQEENSAIRPPNGGRIIDYRSRNGIYFERRLALKFAAWLDPEFEAWVFSTIDEILFGHYKEHWDAHLKLIKAKEQLTGLKEELLTRPTPEKVNTYFDLEKKIKSLKNDKTKAIRNQLNLFDEFEL